MDRTAFFTLHADLPREGPGDGESLAWALHLAGVARDARILDAGCGPGADIAGLRAHAPEGSVRAIDAHPPFVAAAAATHAADARVTVEVGDLGAPGGPYDFIWCAGALYFVGIEAGLRAWRSALAPGGAAAFSEVVWLSEARPPAVAEAFADYPAMTDIPGTEAHIAAAGWRSLGHRVISDAAWEAYYTPMDARIAALRPGADAPLAAVLDAGAAEAALWRAYRRDFGYALFVVEPG